MEKIRDITGVYGKIYSIAISLDSKFLISGSPWGHIFVIDMIKGKIYRRLRRHRKSVIGVAITHDGKYIVSVAADKTIKISELETKYLIRKIKIKGAPSRLALSPGDIYIFLGNMNNTIGMWEFATGRIGHTFIGHNSHVTAVAATPDGNNVISGSADRTIKIWDIVTGKLVRTLDGHLESVYEIIVTSDGNNIISGSFDKTIRIWDLKTGELIHTLVGHKMGPPTIALSPDGKYIFSGSPDKTINIWDFAKGTCIHSQFTKLLGTTAMAVSPNGKYLVNTDGSWFTVWDISKITKTFEL